MSKTIFLGFNRMTTEEVAIWAKMLQKDGFTSQEIIAYLEGIDNCLTIQASMSILNSHRGKIKRNRITAKEVLYQAATNVPIPERFIEND